MNRRKPVIIGLGEILWDLLPGGKVLGGAPANFAYHCRMLGTESYVVSSVGKDDLGCEILENMDRLKVAREYISIDESYPTGTVTVRLDEQGHPDYTIHQNVAWDFIPENKDTAEIAAIADVICFGSLAQRSRVSRKSILSYLELASGSCLKIFDINLRQNYYSREVIESSLKFADVLKLNDEELDIVAEMFALKGNETDIANSLIQRFRKQNFRQFFEKMLVERSGIATAEFIPAGDV